MVASKGANCRRNISTLEQGQKKRRDQHALPHVANRCKDFGGGQCGHKMPVRQWDTLGRNQFFHAKGIDFNPAAFVSANQMATHGIVFVFRSKGFHRPALVACGDNHAKTRIHQKKPTRLSVAALRDLIKEVGLGQVDHTG
jgi:hypothetical protein